MASIARRYDLYLHDVFGLVAWSEGFNQLPVDQSGLGWGHSGPGFEYIPGYPALDCDGYTIELLAMKTTGQLMELKLWLGPLEWDL